MQTRLIVRLLDAQEQLLGWGETLAHAPGDGTLRSPGCTVLIDQAASAAWLSVHWPDVHVETRLALDPPRPVVPGAYPLTWPDGCVLRIGATPGSLPPVTIRAPVAVGVPAGSLNAPTGSLLVQVT